MLREQRFREDVNDHLDVFNVTERNVCSLSESPGDAEPVGAALLTGAACSALVLGGRRIQERKKALFYFIKNLPVVKEWNSMGHYLHSG